MDGPPCPTVDTGMRRGHRRRPGLGQRRSNRLLAVRRPADPSGRGARRADRRGKCRPHNGVQRGRDTDVVGQDAQGRKPQRQPPLLGAWIERVPVHLGHSPSHLSKITFVSILLLLLIVDGPLLQ